MNRHIRAIELPVNQNLESSEVRLKLSNARWVFLRVVVVQGKPSAIFEEEGGRGESNRSFFLYRNNQELRCRPDLQWLDSFVFGEDIFHLYGQPGS